MTALPSLVQIHQLKIAQRVYGMSPPKVWATGPVNPPTHHRVDSLAHSPPERQPAHPRFRWRWLLHQGGRSELTSVTAHPWVLCLHPIAH